jgi:3-oxoacyl-[acyl-carrier protein] reductase
VTARRVVVGGASSGLGAAIAAQFASQGAQLLLWSRGGPRLSDVAAKLGAHSIAADATDPGAAELVATAALDLLGGVDVLVLNAGGPPAVPADRTDPAQWRTSLQSLVVTPVDLATRLLPGMRERQWGRVVAVLSSGIREPIAELSYSNSGRAALANWLKTVAGPVAADGVTVNGVLPGRIDTERVARLDALKAAREGSTAGEVALASKKAIPAGRYGTAAEFAATVGFLASDAASYVTGSFLRCDGGMARSGW